VAKALVIHLRSQDIERLKRKVSETKVLLEGLVNPFDVQRLFEDIQKGMTSIDTTEDYVVPMGSAVANFVAGLVVGLRKPKKVKFLIHESAVGNYKEVVVEVKNGQ
jgi:hypothetical protein